VKETTIALLGMMAVLVVISAALIFGLRDIEDAISTAEIAGTRVPPVSCAEDEVIWWTGADRLGCVHFEDVR
jgi:hypothetical protein